MREVLSRRLGGVSREIWLLAGSIAGFLAITVWWLTQDDRVQDFDNGLHTVDAILIHNIAWLLALLISLRKCGI